MPGTAEFGKTTGRELSVVLRSVLAWLLFLALVTCHSSLLFGRRLGQVQGAIMQVASTWTGSPSTVESGANSDSIAEQPAHSATLSETDGAGGTLARQASYGCGDCISIMWTPPAGADGHSCGVANTFSRETGAAIAQDAVIETSRENEVLWRGWAAIRRATENLLAYDSLTAGSFIAVQPGHSLSVPGRTKAGQASGHKQQSAAPP